MAKAFAPDVSVNCVAPGWIEVKSTSDSTEPAVPHPGSARVGSDLGSADTSSALTESERRAELQAARFAAKTPMGRNGDANDVAQAVLFFCHRPPLHHWPNTCRRWRPRPQLTPITPEIVHRRSQVIRRPRRRRAGARPQPTLLTPLFFLVPLLLSKQPVPKPCLLFTRTRIDLFRRSALRPFPRVLLSKLQRHILP